MTTQLFDNLSMKPFVEDGVK